MSFIHHGIAVFLVLPPARTLALALLTFPAINYLMINSSTLLALRDDPTVSFIALFDDTDSEHITIPKQTEKSKSWSAKRRTKLTCVVDDDALDNFDPSELAQDKIESIEDYASRTRKSLEVSGKSGRILLAVAFTTEDAIPGGDGIGRYYADQQREETTLHLGPQDR
jgi:hypothetical protein